MSGRRLPLILEGFLQYGLEWQIEVEVETELGMLVLSSECRNKVLAMSHYNRPRASCPKLRQRDCVELEEQTTRYSSYSTAIGTLWQMALPCAVR